MLGREYSYYLRKFHAKTQSYDAVAERSTDEQSSAIHLQVPAIKEVHAEAYRMSRDSFKVGAVTSLGSAVKKGCAEEGGQVINVEDLTGEREL